MIVEIELPRPHEKQQFLLDNRKRFNVLKCGRRFGKTELCQELILETFEKKEYVGYFSPTYKDLFEVWKTTLNNFSQVIASKNEQVKQIEFINGAKADFWSMDDPDSGRGRKYHRAIMDECEKAGKFQEAWEQAISPTLADFSGDAYFLSTPQFGPTFFKELCKLQEQHPELWKTFVYTTYDNPYIDKAEIDLQRTINHPMVFACEYMAEDVSGKVKSPFFHTFDLKKHVGKTTWNRNHSTFVSFDFNKNPICCNVFQFIEGHIYGIESIRLMNSDIDTLCTVVDSKYPDALFIVTGDHSGYNRSALVKDDWNYYSAIKQNLRLAESQLWPYVNPRFEENQVACNRVFAMIPVTLDKENCAPLIYDCQMAEMLADGSVKRLVKDNRNDIAQQLDNADTLRYFFHALIQRNMIIV